MLEKDRGILLIATKHPYYGRMAFNLAVSIRATEPDVQIAVLHSGRGLAHLTDRQKEVFNHIIEINVEGIEAKLVAYRNSPFEQTLYIDADTAWLPKHTPTELFEKLDGVEFTAITEGYFDIETKENKLRWDYYLWADVDEIIKAYKIERGRLYQYRTEVMYFEKSDTAEVLFDRAYKIFKDPKVKVTTQFAGGVPDELAINIASATLGLHPHEFNWQPSYWERARKNDIRMRKPAELYEKYFLISTGGNRSAPNTVKFYTRVVAAAFRKVGLQFLFPLQSKVSVIEERKKI
jgi:hypothetical protein